MSKLHINIAKNLKDLTQSAQRMRRERKDVGAHGRAPLQEFTKSEIQKFFLSIIIFAIFPLCALCVSLCSLRDFLQL
ncbi:MAG: hypothetical protein AB1546_04985 [bacterium]